MYLHFLFFDINVTPPHLDEKENFSSKKADNTEKGVKKPRIKNDKSNIEISLNNNNTIEIYTINF